MREERKKREIGRAPPSPLRERGLGEGGAFYPRRSPSGSRPLAGALRGALRGPCSWIRPDATSVLRSHFGSRYTLGCCACAGLLLARVRSLPRADDRGPEARGRLARTRPRYHARGHQVPRVSRKIRALMTTAAPQTRGGHTTWSIARRRASAADSPDRRSGARRFFPTTSTWARGFPPRPPGIPRLRARTPRGARWRDDGRDDARGRLAALPKRDSARQGLAKSSTEPGGPFWFVSRWVL